MSTQKATNFKIENNCFKTPVRKERINLHTPVKNIFGIVETATPKDELGGYRPIVAKSPVFSGKIGSLNNFFQDSSKIDRGCISPLIIPKFSDAKFNINKLNDSSINNLDFGSGNF